MKIRTIESFPLRIPLKPQRRMISALGQHTVSHYLLVRITADNGLVGAGEATVMPRWSGETVWGAQAIVDRVFAPLLIGMDVNDIAGIDRRMDQAAVGNWFAKAAIENACWDILGKAAGKPVYELLGGPVRPRQVRCRFSMGAYEPERARRRARELVDEGFTTIKVKVGGEPKADLERVRVVREEAGPTIDLDIDANGGWDADTAVACVNALRDCRLHLVEQPTPRGDFEGLARVRGETGACVMADDTCFEFFDAVELIRHKACDVINVYPGKMGGLRKVVRLVDYAAEHGVACTIGSNLEWDVGTAAMGHLIVGRPNMQVEKFPGDMLGPEYHESAVVLDPIRIEGPVVTVPDGPGLGVTVDWERVIREAAF